MGRIKATATIGITRDVLAKVDEEADKLGINRSAFITLCINQYFKNEEAISILNRAQSLWEQVQAMQAQEQFTLYDKEEAVSKG